MSAVPTQWAMCRLRLSLIAFRLRRQGKTPHRDALQRVPLSLCALLSQSSSITVPTRRSVESIQYSFLRTGKSKAGASRCVRIIIETWLLHSLVLAPIPSGRRTLFQPGTGHHTRRPQTPTCPLNSLVPHGAIPPCLRRMHARLCNVLCDLCFCCRNPSISCSCRAISACTTTPSPKIEHYSDAS